MGSTDSIGVKFKVHFSFAEEDLSFVNRLLSAFDALGKFDLSVTPSEGAPGADPARQASDLVAAADAVVFVLSSATADTPAVAREAKLAQEMSKRTLTVLSQSTGKNGMLEPLEDIKPIWMDTEQAYRRNQRLLVKSLLQDSEWVKRHTALYARARKWRAAGYDPALLLDGPQVTAAKAWTFERPDKAPKPTDLHIDFIRASEEPALAPQAGSAEVENGAGRSDAGQTPSRGLARRAASQFTALLQRQTKHEPAPLETQPVPADAAVLPDAAVESEPLPVPEARLSTEPVPDTGPQAEPPQVAATAASPEPLPEPDEWLDTLPAAMPVVVARTRPAASPPLPGLDLARLAHVPAALKVSRLPAGRTQPYCAPATAAAAPVCASGDIGRAADHGRTNGPAATPPAVGTSPRAPKPGTCPAAPRPALHPAASAPALRLAASAPAHDAQTPEPGTSPRAPRPCVPAAPLVSDAAAPTAGSRAPELRKRPPAPVPGTSPPAARPHMSLAKASPPPPEPAASARAPAAGIGKPADSPPARRPLAGRPGAPPPAARPVLRPHGRPGVNAEDKLDGLLTSLFTEDEDTLEFR